MSRTVPPVRPGIRAQSVSPRPFAASTRTVTSWDGSTAPALAAFALAVNVVAATVERLAAASATAATAERTRPRRKGVDDMNSSQLAKFASGCFGERLGQTGPKTAQCGRGHRRLGRSAHRQRVERSGDLGTRAVIANEAVLVEVGRGHGTWTQAR